jgi:hypothetical protein
MKKLLYGIFVIIGTAILSIAFYLILEPYINPQSQHESEKEIATSKENHEAKQNEVVLDEVEKEHGYKLYRPEQTVKVKGAKMNLTIHENSNEAAVIQDMHEMTHQKVQAEFKEGAIEMTPAHVSTVYKIVSKSNFQHKDKLLEILKRWKQKDFDNIVEDHNDLLAMQGGKIGKATGRLTTREEKEFISNNFRN